MKISGHGLSVEVPPGWEARIFRRGDSAPVMHLASFALHDHDGDFGAAATGRMGADDRFLALVEYSTGERLVPGRGLFAGERPPAPQPRGFSARQLQVTRPGQLGWQRFFTDAGRPFCAYAVIAPRRVTAAKLVSELGGVLATVRVTAAR